jgi:CelD/BcsL family acetyltransferase involved in cellulose biosynthesis
MLCRGDILHAFTQQGFKVTSLSDRPALTDVMIEVITLDEAEPIWRMLEQQASGSPYQRFDWIAAFAATDRSALRHAVLHLRNHQGQTIALLGMSMCVRLGVRMVEFIGGRQANLHMPLLNMALLANLAEISPSDWKRYLSQAAHLMGGADLFVLINQPRIWNGHPNTLTEAGPYIEPEGVHSLALDPDAEITLKRVLSKDTRKKMRQKGQKLEAIGPVSLLLAKDDAEISAIFDAFLTQKAARFRELAIEDPFGSDDARAFLQLAAQPKAEGVPALELYGLRVGNRIVATMGGVRDTRRFSGMFLSFDSSDPEVVRNSPGDQMVMRIIADCCAKGLTTFDLGAGEARYKTMFCDSRDPLAATAVATSFKGKIAVAAVRLVWMVKQRVKRHPLLLAALRKIRAII